MHVQEMDPVVTMTMNVAKLLPGFQRGHPGAVLLLHHVVASGVPRCCCVSQHPVSASFPKTSHGFPLSGPFFLHNGLSYADHSSKALQLRTPVRQMDTYKKWKASVEHPLCKIPSLLPKNDGLKTSCFSHSHYQV